MERGPESEGRQGAWPRRSGAAAARRLLGEHLLRGLEAVDLAAEIVQLGLLLQLLLLVRAACGVERADSSALAPKETNG